MLEKLETLEQVYAIVKDDPVRTHIPADQRLQQGKDVFVLRGKLGKASSRVDKYVSLVVPSNKPISRSDFSL